MRSPQSLDERVNITANQLIQDAIEGNLDGINNINQEQRRRCINETIYYTLRIHMDNCNKDLRIASNADAQLEGYLLLASFARQYLNNADDMCRFIATVLVLGYMEDSANNGDTPQYQQQYATAIQDLVDKNIMPPMAIGCFNAYQAVFQTLIQFRTTAINNTRRRLTAQATPDTVATEILNGLMQLKDRVLAGQYGVTGDYMLHSYPYLNVFTMALLAPYSAQQKQQIANLMLQKIQNHRERGTYDDNVKHILITAMPIQTHREASRNWVRGGYSLPLRILGANNDPQNNPQRGGNNRQNPAKNSKKDNRTKTIVISVVIAVCVALLCVFAYHLLQSKKSNHLSM